MNFSFWPLLWFGLPGRLLTKDQEVKTPRNGRSANFQAGEVREPNSELLPQQFANLRFFGLACWNDSRPKDPPVLNILWRANFHITKRYGEVSDSEVLVFLGKFGSKSLQIGKNYGRSKIVRIQTP